MDEQTLEAVLLKSAKSAIAYRQSWQDRLQRPLASYAEMRRSFPSALPPKGIPADAVIADLIEAAEPGLHAMTGGRFFAWVIGGSHPVGVAADWLTSAWGQNCGNHMGTPAAAAEDAAAQGLLDVLDLPRKSSVGFVTGATVANFVCLAAARSRTLLSRGWDVESKGLFGAPPIQILIGEDAHTTVFAALQMLGLGHDRVVRVPTDDQGRMLPDRLSELVASVDGPAIVITQAGQINTGAFDPVGAIADIAHAKQAWVHVDGAFGLWARACPAVADQAAGLEKADSWATDGHKWLQTPYDCGFAIVRDSDAHRRAMTAAASYLPSAGEGERDPSHYVPELSRRARGFATWAMLRHLGREGLSEMVARHCGLARRMAGRLASVPGVHVLNDVTLNQAIVRFGERGPSATSDDLTRRVIGRLQSDGICFAGGAKWRDVWVMRLSVIGWLTTEAEADRSVDAIVSAHEACLAGVA